MRIETWDIARVKPYPGNPRKNERAVDAVARSIGEFGFRVPLVVDAEGVLITGHTRLLAAQKLGLREVPVHVARDLSPEQVRAYRIADNATADLAEWDYDLLPVELGALKDAEYDLAVTALDAALIEKMLAGEPAAPAEVTGTDPGESGYREQYGVIVMCGDEEHQERVYAELNAAGHTCRVVCT